jgi:hypothetical protein
MAIKKGHEIPTIDVVLITITTKNGVELGLNTASKLGVNVQTETQDAVKLVVKGRLLAQKPEQVTITGNTLVLTDNVFTPELVKIFQGGVIKYWSDADKTSEGNEDKGFGVARYTPPVAGSDEKGEVFITNAYSAIYNAAGVITGYERISYPNCKATPVALSSEDGAFRAPEYTINSAPDTGEPPYEITYPKELPVIEEVGA